MNSVFTVGYQEKSISEFLEKLKKNNISVLIDIREIPASRSKGFSKNQLNDALNGIGIKYIHVKELGSPKKIREKLHNDNDYNYFMVEYKKHLEGKLDILMELYRDTITTELSCLMCMERLPSYCHRKIVAEKIKEIDGNGLQIVHI